MLCNPRISIAILWIGQMWAFVHALGISSHFRLLLLYLSVLCIDYSFLSFASSEKVTIICYFIAYIWFFSPIVTNSVQFLQIIIFLPFNCRSYFYNLSLKSKSFDTSKSQRDDISQITTNASNYTYRNTPVSQLDL